VTGDHADITDADGNPYIVGINQPFVISGNPGTVLLIDRTGTVLAISLAQATAVRPPCFPSRSRGCPGPDRAFLLARRGPRPRHPRRAVFAVDSLAFYYARPVMTFGGLMPLILANLVVVLVAAVALDIIRRGVSAGSAVALLAVITFGVNVVFGNSKSAALQNYLTQLASEGTANGNPPNKVASSRP
jgi:uncharacterized membrane protein